MTTEAPAIVDPLSGLFTQAFLSATLPTRVATARRAMKQLGLVTIVLDGARGDDAATIGEVVRVTLRDSDTGVRLDDDRYSLLLEFTPVEGCQIISRRLIDRLAEELPGVGVAIGIASYPVHAINAAELLEAADRAAREAADAGPGTIAVAPLAD